MRYLFIVFLFLAYASTGQVLRTAGIAIGSTVPTHTPTTQGALKYYRTSTGVTYKYYNGAWVAEVSTSDNWGTDTVRHNGTLTGEGTVLLPLKVDTTIIATRLYVNAQGFLTAEVDGSTSNELQYVDTLALSGTTLSISLYQDGQGQKTVDLSALQDGTGTDDQVIDTFDIVTNQLRISVESDGVPVETVDLSPYLDNTDAQGLTIGGTGPYTVDISGGADVTIESSGITTLSEPSSNVLRFTTTEVDGSTTNEIQNLDTFTIVSNVLRASLLNDGIPFSSVDLSPYLDDTDTDNQIVDTFTIVSNVLRLSLQDDAVPFEDVDLSPYIDNTDAQTLSFSSPTLSISGGNSVNISAIDTDTDDQGLTIGGTGPTYTVDIDGGADVTIAAAGINTLSEGTANILTITGTEVDGSVSNELQTYGHAGTTTYTNTLSDGGGSFSITGAGINVVSQTAGAVTVTGTEVDGSVTNEIQSISVTGTTTATIDLSDDATDASITGAGISAISVVGNAITVTSTEVDGSTTNELQDLTVTGSGPTYALDMSNGADVTVEGAGIVTLSEGTANVLTITATEVDGSTSNEIQDITLSGTTTVTFDLSGDATDATITGAGIAAISRSGNDITVTATEVDGSTSNEIQTISVTDDGTTFDFDLSGTASDFALVEGTGITLSRTGNDVTIESTGGADDQNLTITGAGPDYVIDIESGNDVTISAAGITTLSEGTANVLTITSTEVDGSVTNEIQSISVTGTTTATLDLSDDATDASITGAGIAAISVAGNAITVTATEVDGSTSNELQDLTIGGAGPTYTVDIASGADVTIAAAGIVTLSEGTANVLTVTATEAQTFSGSDDGTTFTLDLSGAATDIAFKEGSNVTITRTGTELTFTSTGSADNWGTDVVNKNGTLTGDGTVASVLKVDTTVISTKDFVYKGKVTQETSETIKTSNFTAVKTVIHPVDCSAGTITVTPPSSPAIGDRFAIVDSEAAAGTNNITIDFTTGSYKLYTAVQNYIINVDGGYVEFIYMGTTTGWIATKG